MSSRLVGFAIAAAIAVLAWPAAAPAAAADTYVVGLSVDPLATYDGGVGGIPATSPAVTRDKLKAASAPGLDYRAYVAGRQRAVLSRVRGADPEVVYSYRYAFAGFAAELTPEQAARLEKDPGVSGVWKDTLEHTLQAPGDADAALGGPNGESASYLRLSDPVVGLWDRLGGPLAAGGAGAGVIVGDIDTGIQPQHPSFADTPAEGYAGDPYAAPGVWNGVCQAGDGFTTADCNHKLIGARYYLDGFGRANLDPGSFVSPRDDDGHGTHTASTAAGNYGVQPQIDGNDLGVGVISGIAPRAYVAAYKVCWNGNGTSRATGCASTDIVKAIDQAVADGVDVINMSLGSDTAAVIGPQELALLNAAKAGVFVANSAGNAGPGAGTVGSPSSVPWTTSVAASSSHRAFTSTVTVSRPGQPALTLKGASVTGAVAAAPLVDAASAGRAGVASADAALCRDDTLDPAKVTGKVVLCLRGANARVNKSLNVLRAGGVGLILYNPSDAQEVDTDTHWVPTAHVNLTDGQRIKAAIAAGGATAALSRGQADPSAPARVMAAFSSRGPQTAVADIPKPDVTAPGVQVLAGAADAPAPTSELRTGQLFQAISGTSMAAPHVAGAAALLTQANPTLSAAELKSQLMLTANPNVLKEDGVTPADPFDDGSGEIDPNRAAESGLVLDTTYQDYLGYLEYLDPTLVSGDVARKRPSDLNLPAIAFSRFAGRDSTTRTFRSVDATAGRWAVSVQAPPGLSASVSTTSFEIRAGQTQDVTVRLQQVTAPLDRWTFGALVLTSGSRTLRLPISVKPAFASVPGVVSVAAATAAGTQTLNVTPGYNGAFSAVGWGLAAPSLRAAQRVSATTRAPVLTGADAGTKLYPVAVRAGAQLLSARLSNVDAGDAATDLDLYVYRDPNGDGNYADAVRVGVSNATGSAEKVDLTFPAAGSYVVAVVGYAAKAGGSQFDLTTWVVADPSPDNAADPPALSVTGEPRAAAGVVTPLSLNWSGVAAKGTYLGVVTYHGSAAPTAANVSAVSIVELTKTVDEPAGGAPVTPTPTPEPTPVAPAATPSPSPAAPPATPRPSAPAPSLTIRSVSVRGRTVTLRLRSSGATSVRLSVKRGGRFVAKAPARAVRGPIVRLKLDRRLRRGAYTVKVVAAGSGRETVRSAALRVRG